MTITVADRAYQAEDNVDPGRTFADIAAVQSYLDAVTSTSWWSGRFPHIVRVEALEIRSRTFAALGCTEPERRAGVVGVTANGRCELTVLHEVAHAVCGAGEGHGAVWARSYLEVVYRLMGAERWSALRNAFAGYGVDFG